MDIFAELKVLREQQKRDYVDVMQGFASIRDSMNLLEQSFLKYQENTDAMFEVVERELQKLESKSHTH